MTGIKAPPRTYCGQHRRPLAECDDWDRHNHSMRLREDDWRRHEHSALALRLETTTEYIDQAANAAEGYIRCHRGACMTDAPAVPVTFGNLDGKTLGEWITEAVKRAESQHPRHQPVMIGVPFEGAPPVAPFAATSVRFVEPKEAGA